MTLIHLDYNIWFYICFLSASAGHVKGVRHPLSWFQFGGPIPTVPPRTDKEKLEIYWSMELRFAASSLGVTYTVEVIRIGINMKLHIS